MSGGLVRLPGLESVQGMSYAFIQGLVGSSEDVKALDHILTLLDLEPGIPWLIDNRGEEAVPGLPEVSRLASFFDHNADRIGHTRVALVSEDPAALAMANVLARRIAPLSIELRGFRSDAVACRWLAHPQRLRARRAAYATSG